MRIGRRGMVCLLWCLAVGTALPVAAQAVGPRVRAACSGDAQRLCPGQKLGTPGLRYCMESRSSSISRSCVRALEDEGIIPRGYLRR